jgi:transposase
MDFKVKAVELSLQNDIQVKSVAEGLDIHPMMLSRWRKEYREGKIYSDNKKRVDVTKYKQTPQAESRLKAANANLRDENKQLKSSQHLRKMQLLEKENAKLKKENDLLKKWQRYLSEVHQNDLNS